MQKILTLLLLLIAAPAWGQNQFKGPIQLKGPMKITAPTVAPRLIDNLSAFYACESGAVTTDSSVNGLTLTNNNAVTSVSSPALSNGGDFCQLQLSFSQSLSRADNTLLDGDTVDFAYGFWFNTSAGYQVLLSKGIGASLPGYGAVIDGSGVVTGVAYDSTTGAACSSAAGRNDGGWHFVVVNHSRAGNMECFIDGVSVSTYPMTVAPGTVDSSAEFRIGRGSPAFGDNYYQGYMDQIFFVKGAIVSSADVTWLYNGGAARTYAEVLAH